MIVTLHRPAPLADLAPMLAASLYAGAGPKIGVYEAAARHAHRTRSWGAWRGEMCIACGGLYDQGGALEAWFACRPEAGPAIGSIARQARLTLSLIAETERVEIFARVAAGWRPGERLARALGFTLLEAGSVERWGLCPT